MVPGDTTCPPSMIQTPEYTSLLAKTSERNANQIRVNSATNLATSQDTSIGLQAVRLTNCESITNAGLPCNNLQNSNVPCAVCVK